ncbi:MAG: hypothetical protein H6900_01570 [Rhodobacter sp.]|uniref:hypothetical protein n=1 Tax=Pararhodobacter sp. TaxID=2127056 RepID=UPI001E100D4E|nr:hypothetical protein [Pararhodobacter sp.]MCB1347091.1 hypothetical protein [Paracoccaceae bacterium]MCC0071956.1 hypothetical protein [Rhodobacter sp.]HPD91777.1 hypothetical protein [Pararhodobacter sp.]
MTALEKYARLEGPGVWRAGADAQRRDVVVSLGESSLMIADTRSGQALSHWSLPAVQRLTRGTRPAVYAPSIESEGETLEIDDALLIEALETIHSALAPRPPTRWLRLGMIGAVAVLAVAAALWVPGVLVERTAAIVPPAMRAQIGREALDGMTLSAASARLCANPEGRQALATLRTRVLGADWRVSVVSGVPGFEIASLPGRQIVLGDDLVSRLDSGEALAGWLAAEALDIEAHDPLIEALHYAGTRATVTLLVTGTLAEDALRGYALQRFARPPAMPEAEALGGWLDGLGVSSTAYALSLPDGWQELAQRLADRTATAPRTGERLLSDGEWLTVQGICAN